MSRTSLPELEVLVNGIVERGARLDGAHLETIAEAVGRVFSVQSDEVAILSVTPDGKFLVFRVPEKLHSVGQIPLTSTSALVARTVRGKKAEIINHFHTVPHASVFEAVPLKEERGDPIHKIMSVPICLGNKVVGAMQVSRKAKTSQSAGPDFTEQHLRQLIAIAQTIAPCLPLCED